jgi:hypothetical protein
MATTAEKRAWLAANGHPELENGRGRLAAELAAEYDAAHAPPGPDDYGPGTSPDDFVTADDPLSPAPGAADWPADDPGAGDGAQLPAPPAAADAPAAAEERPQRPRAARRGPLWRRRPQTGQGRARTPKKKHPRVSVAPLIEDAYADLAWAAKGIPPMQRLLYAQAPVAGVILDPHVKDTFVDRVILQAAARNYERSKVFLALVGTPAMLMGALVSAPQPVLENGKIAWQAAVGPDGAPILHPETGEPVLVPRMEAPTLQHQTTIVGLRYCVRALADLSGDALTRVQARAEANAERDGLVDDFLAYLMGTEVPADPDESAKAEGGAAGLRLAGLATAAE